MAFLTVFAIYFILWWLCLFVVLAFKGPTQMEEGAIILGTDPSAPSQHKIWKYMLVNTVFTGIIFIICWGLISYYDLGFDDIPRFGPNL